MIYLIFATYPEAAFTIHLLKATPLPSALKLEYVHSPQPTLYRFSKGYIHIIGQGRAGAKRVPFQAQTGRFINLGVCGTLKDHSPFSIYSIARVSHKNVCYHLQNVGAHLLSVDCPLHGVKEGDTILDSYDLVDMESFGLIQRAYLEGKNIEMWKCVSDCVKRENSIDIKKRMPKLSKKLGIHAITLLKTSD